MKKKHCLTLYQIEKLKRCFLVGLMLLTPMLTLITTSFLISPDDSSVVHAAESDLAFITEGDRCADVAGSQHFPHPKGQGLDVILYVDESYSAGNDSFQQEVVHLLIESLLVDSVVRDAEHRVSVWAFAEHVVTLSDGWRRISEGQMVFVDDIHQDIANRYEELKDNNRSLGNTGITNLQLVLEEAVSLAEEEDSDNMPVVIILNDMDQAIGQDRQATQEDFTALYEEWEPMVEDAFLYILAFETGNKDIHDWFNTEILEKLEGRGGLRTINDDNKLSVIQGILREATKPVAEQILPSPFDWFSSQNLEVNISLHAERVVFAFMRNTPEIDISAPSPLGQSGQAFELRGANSDFGYAVIFEQVAPFPHHQWQLQRMGTGQDVLFAVREYGGLQFSFNTGNPYVLAGDSVLVRAGQFDAAGAFNETEPNLEWRPQNIDDWHSEQPQIIGNTNFWTLETTLVSEPTEYVLRIPEYELQECFFTIVPRPNLQLERPHYDGANIEVTVLVEHYNRLALSANGRGALPSIKLEQQESISLTEPESTEMVGNSLRLDYVFTPTMLLNIGFDSKTEWRVKADLQGKTQEGFDIHTDAQQIVNENVQVIILTPTPSPPIPIPTSMITMSLWITPGETMTSHFFQGALTNSKEITNGNTRLNLAASDESAYVISIDQPAQAIYLPVSIIRGLVGLLLAALIFTVFFTLIFHWKLSKSSSANLPPSNQVAEQPTSDPPEGGNGI